jgi:hypothetical protein
MSINGSWGKKTKKNGTDMKHQLDSIGIYDMKQEKGLSMI